MKITTSLSILLFSFMSSASPSDTIDLVCSIYNQEDMSYTEYPISINKSTNETCVSNGIPDPINENDYGFTRESFTCRAKILNIENTQYQVTIDYYQPDSAPIFSIGINSYEISSNSLVMGAKGYSDGRTGFVMLNHRNLNVTCYQKY